MPLLGYEGTNWSLLVKAIIPAVLISLLVSHLLKYPHLPKMMAYQGVKKVMQLNLTYRAGDWQKIERDNVIVYFNEEDSDAVPIVLSVSEEAFAEVNQAFSYWPGEKIPVMVYSDKIALNQSFGWDSDVSAMGVYWAGVIKILSPYDWATTDDLQLMEEEFRHLGPVTHEYVHLVVDELTRGNYTRWFTEALAQYWEREITGFQFDSSEGDLRQELYPLEKMDRQFDSLPNQALAYSQSLAMADFLYEKYGHQKVKKLLVELGKGLPMSKAFNNIIDLDLAGFEEEFHRWLQEEYLGKNNSSAKAHQRLQVS